MSRSWEDIGEAQAVNEKAEHDIRDRMDAHADAYDRYQADKREGDAHLAAKAASLSKELRKNLAECRALRAEREAVHQANARASGVAFVK